jgi:hypothetical protein
MRHKLHLGKNFIFLNDVRWHVKHVKHILPCFRGAKVRAKVVENKYRK